MTVNCPRRSIGGDRDARSDPSRSVPGTRGATPGPTNPLTSQAVITTLAEIASNQGISLRIKPAPIIRTSIS
jgi:hypothetical protein